MIASHDDDDDDDDHYRRVNHDTQFPLRAVVQP